MYIYSIVLYSKSQVKLIHYSLVSYCSLSIYKYFITWPAIFFLACISHLSYPVQISSSISTTRTVLARYVSKLKYSNIPCPNNYSPPCVHHVWWGDLPILSGEFSRDTSSPNVCFAKHVAKIRRIKRDAHPMENTYWSILLARDITILQLAASGSTMVNCYRCSKKFESGCHSSWNREVYHPRFLSVEFYAAKFLY